MIVRVMTRKAVERLLAEATRRGSGTLRPLDLVDILDLLGEGRARASVARRYGVSLDVLDTFLLRHRNATVTKYPPAYANGAAPDLISRPSKTRSP